MTEFQRQSAIVALKKMFEGSYFDICTVDKVIRLSGCTPPSHKDYEALNALHCVSWGEMGHDLREQVMLKVLQIFERPGLDLELIDRVIENAGSNRKFLSH